MIPGVDHSVQIEISRSTQQGIHNILPEVETIGGRHDDLTDGTVHVTWLGIEVIHVEVRARGSIETARIVIRIRIVERVDVLQRLPL